MLLGMNTLRPGQSGPDVVQWQNFLIGQGFTLVADGSFGPKTKTVSMAWQQKNGLIADGVIGRQSLAKAIELGFGHIEDTDAGDLSPQWPPLPSFTSLSAQGSNATFGSFSFSPAPTAGNPEGIVIHGDWVAKNITKVKIPQLKGIYGAPGNCEVQFHTKGAAQLQALWAAWEAEGLLPLVQSWAGSWVPRFVRGSRTYLSNHAKGTAFDLNAPWNALGAEPALVGRKGSVRKLVPLANQHGFYWGGHWGYNKGGRPDGMHFELAVISS